MSILITRISDYLIDLYQRCTGLSRMLLYPLIQYNRIQYESRLLFSIVLPLSLAIIVFFILISSKFSGDDSFVAAVQELLQILIGFYITSLTAVSLFHSKYLDEKMKGDAPELDGRTLTRRQFVMHAFGYLSFMSFSLYLIGVVIQLTIGEYIVAKSIEYRELLQADTLLSLLYIFIVANIFMCTLLCLYYLTTAMDIEDKNSKTDQTSK